MPACLSTLSVLLGMSCRGLFVSMPALATAMLVFIARPVGAVVVVCFVCGGGWGGGVFEAVY